MQYFDAINIILGLSAIFNIFLVLLMLLHSDTKLNRSYLCVVFSVVLWILAIIMYRSVSAESTVFWCKILYVVATCIPSLFLYFTYIFLDHTHTLKRICSIFIPQICIIGLILTDGFIIRNVLTPVDEEKIIIFGSGYIFYVLYISVYFILAFSNLFRTYYKSYGIKRLQVKYILWGCLLASGIATITNLFLPWIGYFKLNWMGQIASLTMTSFTVYAIIKHRLFDFQIRTQRILNIIIPIVVAIGITGILRYIVSQYMSVGPAVLGLTMLMFYTVLYEILRRVLNNTSLSYLLFQRTRRYQLALNTVAEEASTILDLDVLTKKILTALVDEMRVEKAAIFISTSGKSNVFEVLKESHYAETDVQKFFEPPQELIEALSANRVSYIYDEIEYELQQDLAPTQREQLQSIQGVLKNSHTAFILALRVQKVLMGFIILGNKAHNKSYSVEDVELLERVSKELAVALVNSKLHQEKTNLATLLQEEVRHAVDAWKEKSKENEELSGVRSQFLSIASHQLRTPISVVRNSLQLILEDYLYTPAKGDFTLDHDKMQHVVLLLNNAFLASENLKNTTDSILAASELIGAIPSLRIQQIETLVFLQIRVKRAQNLLNAKSENHISLNIEIDSEVPKYIVSDENKLGMVIDNIFSNAVLYTLKGNISVHVHVMNQYLIIEIADTGIGIPKEQQPKIFQRFLRMENAQRVVPDGSGLGLYLAKEYIELLRGEISFTSTEGKGTIFTIQIPLEYRYIAT